MSLSGFFLITFLILHLIINLFSLLPNPDLFNEASHFMASNPMIQIMQYVLAFGFIMHIGTGIRLTYLNNKARPVKYVKDKPGESSTAASRSMIYTGLLILAFLCLHLYDYFYKIKFVGVEDDYLLVTELFDSWLYTLIYVVSFILLGIHLYHGFESAFQSLGVNHRKYTPILKKIGLIYSAITAAGFSLIAIYHFIF